MGSTRKRAALQPRKLLWACTRTIFIAPEAGGYAGQVASGSVRPGDEVVVLPSGRTTTVAGIDTPEGQLGVAAAGQSVVLRLTDDVDVARGHLVAARAGAPEPLRELGATVCVLTDRPLRTRDRLLVKHGTATVTAVVTGITSRIDLDELASVPADELVLNDIGHPRRLLGTGGPCARQTGTGTPCARMGWV